MGCLHLCPSRLEGARLPQRYREGQVPRLHRAPLPSPLAGRNRPCPVPPWFALRLDSELPTTRRLELPGKEPLDVSVPSPRWLLTEDGRGGQIPDLGTECASPLESKMKTLKRRKNTWISGSASQTTVPLLRLLPAVAGGGHSGAVLGQTPTGRADTAQLSRQSQVQVRVRGTPRHPEPDVKSQLWRCGHFYWLWARSSPGCCSTPQYGRRAQGSTTCSVPWA